MLCVTTLWSAHAHGQTIVFQENFDQLPLRPPVDEDPNGNFSQAFTHTPPDNWFRDASGVPGVQNPSIGVTEWEGWSFANKNFWIDVSGNEGRSLFTRGDRTIAVADPDEWNDLGDPANNIGFYKTFLETPFFDIGELREKGPRLKFQFDSSWRPQCCDDGENFDPNGNNQSATFRAIFEDGSQIELDRWESAPFVDPLNGRPSIDPNDDPNPFFKSADLNELFFLDLSPVLQTSHLGFKIAFGMEDAGDDWWFAMDNMQMISITEELGDMDLNGVVDEDDIDDFAQAMHNSLDYALTHAGESPAIRGSLDDDFNFDDIDWFINLLNGGGVAASRDTILEAIRAQAVPEPSTAGLAGMVMCVGLVRGSRRHRA